MHNIAGLTLVTIVLLATGSAPALATEPQAAGAAGLSSANLMYREFEENAVDASNHYVGKTVTLEGLRGDLILMPDGIAAAVHIADRGKSNALILVFTDRNDLAGIGKGQRFHFTCVVGKFEYGTVWMEDCTVNR